MIKPEEIKPGLFIWWEGKREGFDWSFFKHQWSCPFIVSAVSKTRFSVVSIDDFREIKNIPKKKTTAKSGEINIFSEMEICSPERMQKYVEEKLAILRSNLYRKRENHKEASKELKKSKKAITKYKEGLKNFIKKRN